MRHGRACSRAWELLEAAGWCVCLLAASCALCVPCRVYVLLGYVVRRRMYTVCASVLTYYDNSMHAMRAVMLSRAAAMCM
eukprot:scaffold18289_cov126-Isochrysis_galbana.AAC.3